MDRATCRCTACVVGVLVLLVGCFAGVSGALGATASSAAGDLPYLGGPVLHSSRPYLIFWTPSGESIAASSESLMEQYFTDVAGDSGKSSNSFGVLRQYYDRTGFADYRQAFDSARQVIVDTEAYPPRNPLFCPAMVTSTYPTCISDLQIQAELQRLITSKHQPTAGSLKATTTIGSVPARLPADAPIYFVVLPADVAFCYALGTQCTTEDMGAYHLRFADAQRQVVLYAAIATDALRGATPPPGIFGPCQPGDTSVPQQPNHDQADCVINALTHEDSETISDPMVGYNPAWRNPGLEAADECQLYGPFDPAHDYSPDAYQPTLGGSEAAGTLYTQLINGHPYNTQCVWSNGNGTCEMRPTAGRITPRLRVRGRRTVGASIDFNPAASTSTNPLSSATWNFGDRSKPAFLSGHAALTRVTHRYRRAGRYTVTLTLVDGRAEPHP